LAGWAQEDGVLTNALRSFLQIDFNLATFVEKGKANLTEAVGCVVGF
jgi:hypothetical protein